MPQHDKGNKLVFSHIKMVRDLLVGYVHHPWVRQAELDTLERKFNSYVTDDMRERLDDMLWRVRWKDGRWLYVYLLLEFQSTVDPIMALRIMGYVALLLQDLIKSGEALPGELPPVLPIVLYNGSAVWTAPLEVSELMAPAPPGLLTYQPQGGRYLLLDQKRTDDQELFASRNLVAALFQLEKSRTLADILAVVDKLAEWLAGPENADLARSIAIWVNDKAKLPPERQFTNLLEAKSMLEETIQGWYDEKQELGRKQGEAAMLQRLMELRFGPLKEDVQQKVASADAETLMYWAERFLSAQRAEDVIS